MQNPSDLIALSRCLYVRIQSSRANDPFQNGSRFQEEGKVFFFYEFSYRYIYLQSRSKESWIELDRRSIPVDYYINRNKVQERYQKTYIYILLQFLVQWRENYPELSASLSSMSFVSKLKVFQRVSVHRSWKHRWSFAPIRLKTLNATRH